MEDGGDILYGEEPYISPYENGTTVNCETIFIHLHVFFSETPIKEYILEKKKKFSLTKQLPCIVLFQIGLSTSQDPCGESRTGDFFRQNAN